MRSPLSLALLAALLFAALTTAITWVEHQTYNSTSLDLAVYTQLVWNTGIGQPFSTTLLLQNHLHLAEHLALLLLPLAPLYALLPDPRLLLLLQQGALALAGLAVYWLARRRLNGWLALLPLLGYYLMPSLDEVAFDAFYPIAFAAVPVGLAAALALERRWRSASLLALLAVLFEEEAALPLLGLGLYLAIFRKGGRAVGLLGLAAGLLWLTVGEAVVMPRFQQPSSAVEATRAGNHFGELRANPLGWVGSVALNRLDPDLLRASGLGRWIGQPAACPQAGHCSALRWWLYPTGGLALLSPPTLLMTAPGAAALLLADKPGRFRRHWVAPMLPVIWIATVVGLANLGRQPPGLRLLGAALMLAAIGGYYALDSSLPLGGQFEPGDLVATTLSGELAELDGAIPPRASVAASRRGLAHLANRPALYAFPPKDYGPGLWPPAELPEYALIDLANADSQRELDRPSGEVRWSGSYHELERRSTTLLLKRSGG
jgi:predicted membrane protein DUF2079